MIKLGQEIVSLVSQLSRLSNAGLLPPRCHVVRVAISAPQIGKQHSAKLSPRGTSHGSMCMTLLAD